jgi:hypothetical protein
LVGAAGGHRRGHPGSSPTPSATPGAGPGHHSIGCVHMSIGCRQEIEVGAYLLDALEPAERARFTQHLSGCQVCRVEVEQLAPTAWRLLTFGESLRATLAPRPSPTLRPRAGRGQRPEGADPRTWRDDDGARRQRRGNARRWRCPAPGSLQFRPHRKRSIRDHPPGRNDRDQRRGRSAS